MATWTTRRGGLVRELGQRVSRSPVLALVLMVLLAPGPGCAGSRHAERKAGAPAVAVRPAASPGGDTSEEADVPEGAIHKVEPGQTLWRIARAYGVDLQDLCRANGITDPNRLPVGRVLFVPGATSSKEVAPYPAPFASRPLPEGGKEVPARIDGGFVWPVPGGELLSPFAAPRRGHRHAGLDIRGVPGQEVLATHDGEVVYSGDTRGDYGRIVILRHREGLQSLYAHNSKLLVKVGDRVERGQPVALVGRTGNASTAHCHFELRRGNIPVDPTAYLVERAPTATAAEFPMNPRKTVRAVTGPSTRSGRANEP